MPLLLDDLREHLHLSLGGGFVGAGEQVDEGRQCRDGRKRVADGIRQQRSRDGDWRAPPLHPFTHLLIELQLLPVRLQVRRRDLLLHALVDQLENGGASRLWQIEGNRQAVHRPFQLQPGHRQRLACLRLRRLRQACHDALGLFDVQEGGEHLDIQHVVDQLVLLVQDRLDDVLLLGEVAPVHGECDGKQPQRKTHPQRYRPLVVLRR